MDLAPPLPALFQVIPIQADRVPGMWPRIAGMIEQACARPGCPDGADEYRAACEAGEAELFLGLDHDRRIVAAGIMQIRDYEVSGRRAWLLAVGGRRFAPWPYVFEVVEQMARAAGARSVEFIGRPGWSRFARDYTAEPSEGGFHYIKRLGRLN